MEKEVSLGTLYNLNKTAILKEKTLKDFEIKDKIRKIKDNFIVEKGYYSNSYYVLLCREKYDFTVFRFNKANNEEPFEIAFYDCLTNRGDIKSIDFVDNAVEIWIVDREKKEAFVYYFFSYNKGVLEVI